VSAHNAFFCYQTTCIVDNVIFVVKKRFVLATAVRSVNTDLTLHYYVIRWVKGVHNRREKMTLPT